MLFLLSNGGDFLSNLVNFYIILVFRPVLADWRRRTLFGTTDRHDHLLRSAEKHRGCVGNLLVHVQSDVDRFDVGFSGESGL